MCARVCWIEIAYFIEEAVRMHLPDEWCMNRVAHPGQVPLVIPYFGDGWCRSAAIT